LGELSGWDVEILATDVAEATVQRARTGQYSELEIGRGMPPDKRDRWFQQVGDRWSVREEIKSMVRFSTRNLLGPIPEADYFDIVFCRNVLIYFSLDDRRLVVDRITQSMVDDGVLFVGASESLMDLGPHYAPQVHCRSVLYRPKAVATA
jgi:chemotaxis protein methyltransferase CheR